MMNGAINGHSPAGDLLPDSPAAIILREVRREVALAEGMLAQFSALKDGAVKLAPSVRHGLVDRATVVDELLEQADNVGLLERAGEGALQRAIADALNTFDEPMLVTEGFPDHLSPAPSATGCPPVPLGFTDVSIWQDRAIPPRRWLVHNRVPMSVPALLSGDGAAGKTTIALQLAVATVLGLDWLGEMIDEPGPVLFFTAEEDLNEIHRRLDAIARHRHVELRDLAGLHVFSRAGDDAVLGTPDARGVIRATPLLDRLQAAAEDLRPRLIILESAADLFAGNENDRSQVRQFVMLLRRLAMAADAAVLLLAHPSLSGLSSGTGTSGSTGWHNSVRARLYFAAAKDADGEDTGARVLSVKKSNYGPAGETVRVRWQEGAFVMDGSARSAQPTMDEAIVEAAFLACLDAMRASGRDVGPYPGKAYAPALFEKMPQAHGFNARALTAAQERLFAAGSIQVVQVGPPSKARSRIVRRQPE